MLVKLTVEWLSDGGRPQKQNTEIEIEDVGPLVDIMFKLNAIRVTVEKIEEGKERRE